MLIHSEVVYNIEEKLEMRRVLDSNDAAWYRLLGCGQSDEISYNSQNATVPVEY